VEGTQGYSISIAKFLRNYYLGYMQDEADRIHELFDEGTAIQGRCGYLRQAYPFVFTEFDFMKTRFHSEGDNGRMSDLDFYDGLNKIFQQSET